MWGTHLKRRLRKRRVAKWVGVIVCVLSAGIWSASKSHRIGFFASDRYIFAEEGAVRMVVYIHGCKVQEFRLFTEPLAGPAETWQPQPNPLPPSSRWVTWHYTYPFWPWLFFPVAGTLFLFWRDWRDRSPQDGYCQSCGYNLTGNTSGVCPECGVPA